MNKFSYAILLATCLVATSSGATKSSHLTYFSCTVNEPVKGHKTIKVTVKFAVEKLDLFKGKGELVAYPGKTEDEVNEAGLVVVTPIEIGKSLTMMSNLNGQGGDLRVEGQNLKLWGDGDGYQFTELVIWDVEDEEGKLEGYVRDYGPTYGNTETFKQFIKCKRSDKIL